MGTIAAENILKIPEITGKWTASPTSGVPFVKSPSRIDFNFINHRFNQWFEAFFQLALRCKVSYFA